MSEGILTGVSGGSSFAVAIDIAKTAKPGSTILCMLPDTGERYLSSPLFEKIEEEMTSEEIALSESTLATRCRLRQIAEPMFQPAGLYAAEIF